MSINTRRAYSARVAGFLEWLGGSGSDGDPLGDAHARDFAVRDYKAYLKSTRHGPATVNASLAALDHFYGHLGLRPARVRREVLPQAAPRALEAGEQRRFLRAVERAASPRDGAACLLAFYAGLRVAELAALDVDDVVVSARKGQVVVRHGKGDAYREVPLHPAARGAVKV